MSGHTLGPWVATNAGRPDGARCVYADREQIAHVGPPLFWGRGQHGEVSRDAAIQTEANARLIAAAPELLAAVRGLLAITVHPYDGAEFEDGEVPAVDAARTAITKATGGAA